MDHALRKNEFLNLQSSRIFRVTCQLWEGREQDTIASAFLRSVHRVKIEKNGLSVVEKFKSSRSVDIRGNLERLDGADM